MQITSPHTCTVVKESTELLSNVVDFRVIMLTDEEREPGIHLSLPYFLGARSKICRICTQIHQVLCFVGKDWNYFEFNRKTDV